MPRMSFICRSLLVPLVGVGLAAQAPRPLPRHRHQPRIQLNLPSSGPLAIEDAMMLPEWPQLQRITAALASDAAALDLLKTLPQVAENYADPSYFLDFVHKWRSRVPDLAQLPGDTSAQESSWVVLTDGDNRSVYATFPDPRLPDRITVLKVAWIAGQVTGLNCFAGIGHPVPLRRQHQHRWHRSSTEVGGPGQCSPGSPGGEDAPASLDRGPCCRCAAFA